MDLKGNRYGKMLSLGGNITIANKLASCALFIYARENVRGVLTTAINEFRKYVVGKELGVIYEALGQFDVATLLCSCCENHMPSSCIIGFMVLDMDNFTPTHSQRAALF